MFLFFSNEHVFPCRMLFVCCLKYPYSCFRPIFVIIIIIIIIYSLVFFTSALPDDFSLEFEWHQVSSSLQDYSQYSTRSY